MGDSCLQRTRPKVASGISVFLLEELGDARLRCAQLKKYIDEVVGLVEKSEQRDHLFEVASHLIYGIPDTLSRMEKALSAAAMAAAKMDYEEIKDDIRPEKAEELERALEEVRIRRVQRRSMENSMKVQEAKEQLERLASTAEANGDVDVNTLASLIQNLEGNQKTASVGTETAEVIRSLSASLLDVSDPKRPPSRVVLAQALRRVLAESMDVAAAFGVPRIRNRPHGNGVPTVDFTAALNQAAENIFECRGYNRPVQQALEDSLTGYMARIGPLAGQDSGVYNQAQEAKKAMYELDQKMGDTAHLLERITRDVSRHGDASGSPRLASQDNTVAEDTKESRFQEGQPADPTENMSDEDAKRWREEHAKNKDNFKTAALDPAPTLGSETAVLEALEAMLVSVRKAIVSANAGNTKRMFFSLMGVLDQLGVVGRAYDLPEVGYLMRVFKVFAQISGARPTTNFASEKSAASGDPRWIHAKYPGKAQDGEEFKRGDLVLYYPSTKTFMVGKKAEDAWRRFETEVADEDIYNSSRMATTLADQLLEAKFEEGKPADPTENMDADDTKKWKQQTDEHKDEFKTASDWKAAGRKPRDTAEKHQLKVLLDTVRNPMKSLLGGPDADEAEETLQSKFQYTEAEIRKLKQAASEDPWKVEAASGPSPNGSNWRQLKGFVDHAEMFKGRPVETMVWEDPMVAFVVQEFPGPGIPLYNLSMSASVGGKSYNLQTRRPPQFKRQQDAFKFAADWYKKIDAFENGGVVGLDLTTDWKPKA